MIIHGTLEYLGSFVELEEYDLEEETAFGSCDTVNCIACSQEEVAGKEFEDADLELEEDMGGKIVVVVQEVDIGCSIVVIRSRMVSDDA